MSNNEKSNSDLASAEILWKLADTLRGRVFTAKYKHVVLAVEHDEGKQ